MESNLFILADEISEKYGLPFQISGGACRFRYDGIEMLLESPSDSGLLLFISFFPTKLASAKAGQILSINFELMTETPTYFASDPGDGSLILCRCMAIARLSADQLLSEITEFGEETKRLIETADRLLEDSGTEQMPVNAEIWIKG